MQHRKKNHVILIVAKVVKNNETLHLEIVTSKSVTRQIFTSSDFKPISINRLTEITAYYQCLEYVYEHIEDGSTLSNFSRIYIQLLYEK